MNCSLITHNQKSCLLINGYPETIDGHIPLERVPAGGDIGVAGDLRAGEHDAVGALVAVAEVNELGTVTPVVTLGTHFCLRLLLQWLSLMHVLRKGTLTVAKRFVQYSNQGSIIRIVPLYPCDLLLEAGD